MLTKCAYIFIGYGRAILYLACERRKKQTGGCMVPGIGYGISLHPILLDNLSLRIQKIWDRLVGVDYDHGTSWDYSWPIANDV
jgi:hypothetical protein